MSNFGQKCADRPSSTCKEELKYIYRNFNFFLTCMEKYDPIFEMVLSFISFDFYVILGLKLSYNWAKIKKIWPPMHAKPRSNQCPNSSLGYLAWFIYGC